MVEVEGMGCEHENGMETHGKVLVSGERGGEFGATIVEEELDEIVLSESLELASSDTACCLLSVGKEKSGRWDNYSMGWLVTHVHVYKR